MDPLHSWHEGCYCYRDGEVEEARQLGFEVRCGGGLPCSCSLFGDSSFAPVDPLFNNSAAEEWAPLSPDDPLKPDEWPAQDEQPELQGQGQAPPQLQKQQQQQQQQQQQRGRPVRAGSKRGTCDKRCCNCPCTKLHQAAAKKMRCCGENCECSSGACACPDHKVSTSGRCCEGVALHLTPTAAAKPATKLDHSVRLEAPLPEPTSDVSSPDNPANAVFRQVLLSSVKLASPASLLHHAATCGNALTVSPAVITLQPKNKRTRTPPNVESSQSSCCAPAIENQSPLLSPDVPTRSAPVVTNSASTVTTEANKVHVVEGSSGTVFNCTDCTLKFATQRDLESHGAKKHLKNRPYTCYTCSSSFLFKQNRDRHIVEVHQGKRPHQCPHNQCGAAFKNSSGLKQHMRTVHDKERPFKCEQCQSSFGQRNHLTQHVLVVHERRKLFQCTICETSFSNRGNLNQHVRRKHGDHARTPTTSRSKIPSGNPSG